MALAYTNSINRTSCVGNTLSTINLNFSALDVALSALSAYTTISVNFLSSTIISVSSDLYTQMFTASSDLQTQINFVSGHSTEVYNTLNAVSASHIEYIKVNESDQVFTTTLLSAVNDLYFNVEGSKKYKYEFNLDYITTPNSEGLSLSLSGSAGYNSLKFYATIYHYDGTVLATGRGNQYNQPIFATTGHPSSAVALLWGYIHTNTPGVIQLVAATETGGGNTVSIHASSFGLLAEVW